MSHPPPSHCITLGLKMQGHTSVLLPSETSTQRQLSKWKSFVSVSPTLHCTLHIIEWYERGRKILFIELIVFYWLLKGNTLLFLFSSEDRFFISSINGRKTIRGLLNDPVSCAVLVSNGFYFPWMPSIRKCPLEMKSFDLSNWVPLLFYQCCYFSASLTTDCASQFD